MIWDWAGADLDPAPDQPRVERVVVSVEAQVGLGRDAHHPAPVDAGQRGRQLAHPLALGAEAL